MTWITVVFYLHHVLLVHSLAAKCHAVILAAIDICCLFIFLLQVNNV